MTPETAPQRREEERREGRRERRGEERIGEERRRRIVSVSPVCHSCVQDSWLHPSHAPGGSR
jgi:hypothetical protein